MKKFFLFAAICAAMIGCEKPTPVNPDKPVVKPTKDMVKVTPAAHTFNAADALSLEVTVESSADWTLEAPQDSWVNPSAISGKNGEKVVFTAAANTTTEKRGPVTFTFKVGKATATFTAEQLGKDQPAPEPTESFLELTSPASPINVAAAGERKDLTFRSSFKAAELRVDVPQWMTLKLSDIPGSQSVMGVLNVQENKEQSVREGQIKVSGGTLSVVVSVKQEAASAPEPPQPQPGNKLNVVNFHNAHLYSNWSNAAPLTNMSKFTAECLVNSENWSKGWQDAELSTLFGIEGHFLVRAVNGNLEVVTNEGGEEKIPVPGTLSNNQWYHVAVTFDNGNIKAYVNGVEKASKSVRMKSVTFATGAWAAETNWGSKRHFYLGYSCDHQRCLKGDMAEFRIWNRVLSASEITAKDHYYNVDPKSNGLVGYWKLNEGQGVEAKDLTNNGNHMLGHIGMSGNGNGGATVGGDGIQWKEIEAIVVK